jgi:hypothetical protein
MLKLFQREKNWFPDTTSAAGFRQILERVEKSSEEEEQVEGIRLIAEVLISNERRDGELFDLFCENEGMRLLSQIYIKEEPKLNVKVQIIQTLSLLITNLTKHTSLYYLYSRGYISMMAQYEILEEELIENFVAFLKALVLRLDTDTVNFFVDPTCVQVLIFKAGCRWFNDKNCMVAVNARNFILLFLQLMKGNPIPIYTDAQRFFSILAIALRDAYLTLNAGTVSDIRDLLLFVHDLSEIPGNLADLLMEQIASYFLGPTILASLAPDHSPSDKSLDQRLALLALGQLLVCNFPLKPKMVELIKYHFQNTHAADAVLKQLVQTNTVAAGMATLFLATEVDLTKWSKVGQEVIRAALTTRPSSLAVVLGVVRQLELSLPETHEHDIAREIVKTIKPLDLVVAVEKLGVESDMPKLANADSQQVLETFLFSSDVIEDVLSSQKPPSAFGSAVDALTRLILFRRFRCDENSDRFISKLFSLLWFSLAPADTSPRSSKVHVGQLQRLKCMAAGAIGNCYMLLDQKEILLVTPDDQRMEEAKPLMVRPLRGVRECKIENETTLVISTAEDSEPLRLSFEDARRSHIALMHIETRRLELMEELGRSMMKEIETEYLILS